MAKATATYNITDVFCFVETRSYSVPQAGLKLTVAQAGLLNLRQSSYLSLLCARIIGTNHYT